ncbi:MAG: Uma2 family endonuclease [Gemmatales bacterium]
MPATLKKPVRTKRKTPHINGAKYFSRTLADLVHELGDVPLHRILLTPAPGTATESDLIRLMDGEPKQLCELVNGTLVEKVMGLDESSMSMTLGAYLVMFVNEHNLGFVTGPDGAFRMKLKKVRMPDISFVSWRHYPEGRADAKKMAVGTVPPDLAVEILSKSNTKAEIDQKLQEYLISGVKLVWIIDPRKRIVTVQRADGTHTVLDHKGKLSGEDVLPGFKLEISKFL